MTHAVIKLMNGDEIVSEVGVENNDTIKLLHPIQIHRIISPAGYEVVKCSHWLLFSESPEVTLDKKHIMLMVNDINENVLSHYDYFIKHSRNKELQHVQPEENIIDRAERIYKEQQLHRKNLQDDMEQEDLNLEEYLRNVSNTTIH